MKNRTIVSILSILLAASCMFSSCEDMLTPDLDRYATEDRYAQDSVFSAFGILKSIQSIGERFVILDAARSDLATVGTYTTDSIKALANFENPKDGDNALLNVADFYHIINSCNYYLSRVDTVSQKNGKNEMLRETAQIETIRAWAYVQLVRFYGSVPFVTKPIGDAQTALELEKSAPRVNKDNLIDYLLEAGLGRAWELQTQWGMPSNYGPLYYSGGSAYQSSACFIPVQLVMGDAYLMANNYQKAAELYYDYLLNVGNNGSDNNNDYKCERMEFRRNNIEAVGVDASRWARCMSSYNSNEQAAIIVGAANSTIGTTLNAVQHVFGFQTSSRVTTYASDDESTASTYASTSVTANEQYQQILPSESYVSLNEEQKFCRYYSEGNTEIREYLENVGDGRLYGTAPYWSMSNSQDDRMRIIAKFANPGFASSFTNNSAYGFDMNYTIPIYRKSEVYLRYAEAVNRMGFPELAFAVLKDGLFRQNFPTLDYHDENVYCLKYDTTFNEAGEQIDVQIDTVGVVVSAGFDEEGTELFDTLYYADGAEPDPALLNAPYWSQRPSSITGGIYYISYAEMEGIQKYPFLDFITNERWNRQNAESTSYAGIHGRGCGNTGGLQDTVYTYARMVAQKVAENRARLQGLTYDEQFELAETLYNGDELLVTDKDEIINAVEDLIVDESALETAFEGHRFTDLVRIAGHKSDGKAWLGWKMGRRDKKVTDDASQYDATLFGKMQDEKNWYLSLPTSK